METIKYERTWCDYLTPCPYINKDNDPEGIMVGDWECSNCLYNMGNSVNRDKGEVLCLYKEEHQKKNYGMVSSK